jgi:hypothetical protein
MNKHPKKEKIQRKHNAKKKKKNLNPPKKEIEIHELPARELKTAQ